MEAQRTLRGCSYDPTPRFAGLDHKLSPFGNRFQVAFHGYGTAKNACSDTKESFLFGGLSPENFTGPLDRQIKKSLLCVLGVSAVKILFWTTLTKNNLSFSRIDPINFLKIRDRSNRGSIHHRDEDEKKEVKAGAPNRMILNCGQGSLRRLLLKRSLN